MICGCQFGTYTAKTTYDTWLNFIIAMIPIKITFHSDLFNKNWFMHRWGLHAERSVCANRKFYDKYLAYFFMYVCKLLNIKEEVTDWPEDE